MFYDVFVSSFKLICHFRDLKTQNIFLTKAHIVKVGDLGIARYFILKFHYNMIVLNFFQSTRKRW